MSDTPRTDERVFGCDTYPEGDRIVHCYAVTAEFARTLERELTARTLEVRLLRELVAELQADFKSVAGIKDKT